MIIHIFTQLYLCNSLKIHIQAQVSQSSFFHSKIDQLSCNILKA